MSSSCSAQGSGYMPSAMVAAFHNIPHVDIDLNPSPENFELSLDYFEAVIIWACVPILACVCLFILMSVYFICVCCCCCFGERKKRSNRPKIVCGVLTSIMVIFCLGTIGVGIWAEVELNRSLNNVVDTVQDVDNLFSMLGQNSTAYQPSEVTSRISTLNTSIESGPPSNGARNRALVSLSVLSTQNMELGGIFEQINDQLPSLQLGSVATGVSGVELIRHWVVIAYLAFVAAFLLLFLVSICCGACFSSAIFVVIMLVILFFITLTVWIAVGGNLAVLMVSSDICNDPDTLIRNFTTQQGSASLQTVDYYIVCNTTVCTPSPLIESIIIGQDISRNITQQSLDTVQTYITAAMRDLQNDLNVVEQQFQGANDTVGNFSDCTILHQDYLDALESFCSDGVLYAVILFSMACGLAVGLMMAIVCATLYAGLLRARSSYDEETIAYDFPADTGPATWSGTHHGFRPGQYTAYHGESFSMTTSPPPGNPPKYTDLQNTALQNNYSNGRQRHEDRPPSGSYDHFDT